MIVLPLLACEEPCEGDITGTVDFPAEIAVFGSVYLDGLALRRPGEGSGDSGRITSMNSLGAFEFADLPAGDYNVWWEFPCEGCPRSGQDVTVDCEDVSGIQLYASADCDPNGPICE